MLRPELMREVQMLELRAGHLASDLLAGEYASAFKGRGMQFDEVREYVVGDEVRTIDWNVTARTGVPHVKIFREERELTMLVMVDVSPSQGFGVARSKQESAAELAAVLAFLAIRSNDRVGLVLFSDHVERFIPPAKGRAHVWQIIRAVLAHERRGRTTRCGEALEFVMQVQARKALCFMISDFIGEDFSAQLKIAARRHDLVCVASGDPRETQLADAGIVEFHDAESGDVVLIDTGDAEVRRRFAAAAAERSRRLEQDFSVAGASHFSISTGESVTRPLVRFMRRREAMGRRPATRVS